MASLRLTSYTNRKWLVVFIGLTLGIEIVLSLLLFRMYSFGLVVLKMGLASVGAPAVLVVLSVITERHVRSSLTRLPAPLCKHISRQLRHSTVFAVFSLASGVSIAWSVYNPWRMVVVVFIFSLTFTAGSHTQVRRGACLPQGALRPSPHAWRAMLTTTPRHAVPPSWPC